jgi:hypothetical protein
MNDENDWLAPQREQYAEDTSWLPRLITADGPVKLVNYEQPLRPMSLMESVMWDEAKEAAKERRRAKRRQSMRNLRAKRKLGWMR